MADSESEPQRVNRLKGNPSSQRRGDFYANGKNQGEPAKKVTSQHSGAKRDSYFKKRDYY